MAQVSGTKQEREAAAVAFLIDYKTRFGYWPTGHSLGRFCLTLDSVGTVWRDAKAQS